jgi:hypothetical protein
MWLTASQDAKGTRADAIVAGQQMKSATELELFAHRPAISRTIDRDSTLSRLETSRGGASIAENLRTQSLDGINWVVQGIDDASGDTPRGSRDHHDPTVLAIKSNSKEDEELIVLQQDSSAYRKARDKQDRSRAFIEEESGLAINCAGKKFVDRLMALNKSEKFKKRIRKVHQKYLKAGNDKDKINTVLKSKLNTEPKPNSKPNPLPSSYHEVEILRAENEAPSRLIVPEANSECI